ncbi:MAG: paraquat-inducible protein A [Crocinitomicaceae bacterium]|nr:paraquat-inducible protein A [Crocinitomicaceae bacterium]
MKKLFSLPGLGLALVFLIVSFFFINKSVEASNKFKEEKIKVAEILNFNDRLLSFRDWVFSKEAWSEKKAKLDTVMKHSDAHYKKANTYGYYLLFMCLGFFILIVAFYAKKRLYFGLTFAISFISIVLLVQGIMNPILEMSAFKEEMTIKVYVHPDDIPYFEEAVEYVAEVNTFMGDVNKSINLVRIIPAIGPPTADKLQEIVGGAGEYLTEGEAYLNEHSDKPIGFDKVFPGRTYFYYQNKGIMDVITLLWKHDNKPVAAAIGTFSIVVPAIKLIATLLMLLFGVTKAKRFRKFLSYIAKFSMADVFVVSAFLAYLSFANMSAGVDMDAKVLFGLYYFMGYVVLSIFLGILLDKSIKERIKTEELQVSSGSKNSDETKTLN